MRKISNIILHCADTYPRMDVDAKWIKNIHVNEKGYADIGYHFVIKRNGKVEKGRNVSVVGAHTLNYNADSIGICLVGGKKDPKDPDADLFTTEQFEALKELVDDLLSKYPKAEVKGHYEFDKNKTCPNFDMDKWREENLLTS